VKNPKVRRMKYMDIMKEIFQRARENPTSIAFPEATEEKILLAVKESVQKGICKPVLVGEKTAIENAARNYGVSLEDIKIIDSTDEEKLKELVEKYITVNPIMSTKSMMRKAKDPLYVALMMEAVGQVDSTFAGIAHTTGDVIVAAQLVIGLKEGVETASSLGIMDIKGYEGCEGSLIAFADSAVCVAPTEGELASIAISSCDTISSLMGWEPRAAMLSFSTTGSSEHESIDKVREAVRLANERRPDLKIDGEFQLDAALLPAVAVKKVKRESAVAGKANIIIYPELNAGNIGVKLVQVFAKSDAYGPMLQGFAKVISDCSRSASVSELVGNIAITAVRAQGAKK
jgi:phosphate acetyltransferase